VTSTLHLAFRAKRTSQSADTRFFGALRASTLDVRCPFRGCPLSSPRCISPLEQSTTMLNPRQILAFAPWEDVRFGSLAEISHCKSRCLLYPRNQARQSNVLLRAKSANRKAAPRLRCSRFQFLCAYRVRQISLGILIGQYSSQGCSALLLHSHSLLPMPRRILHE
jgi:hypothetical protein